LTTIYYLPGHGGHLDAGLGAELMRRGYDLAGRQTVGPFRDLTFTEQIELVAADLRSEFWHPEAKVIANSFGAYLFLPAQTLLPPYVGQALLLSPIVGSFENEERMMFFEPPRPGQLQAMTEAKTYPISQHCEFHVGELDWQSDPKAVEPLAAAWGHSVTIVPGGEHRLDKQYVSDLLDRWLKQ
jgi:hypothetical protein